MKKRRWKGALTPLLFFAAFCGATLVLVVMEARNYISAPVAEQFPAPSGTGILTLYHKTGRARAADVFWEPRGGGARAVAPLFYSGKDRAGLPRERFEELRWTGDGASVFATSPGGGLLWLYDSTDGTLVLGEGTAAALVLRGGSGEVIARWYDLGDTEGERRLWSWEATRYEKALRELGNDS